MRPKLDPNMQNAYILIYQTQASPMSKEQIEISLRYEGPDVDDGTMSLDDIVPVLQGFSGAYGKIAGRYDPASTHTLKITALNPGSVEMILEVLRTLSENTEQIHFATKGVSNAYRFVKKITQVIAIKRHNKGHPYKTKGIQRGWLLSQMRIMRLWRSHWTHMKISRVALLIVI